MSIRIIGRCNRKQILDKTTNKGCENTNISKYYTTPSSLNIYVCYIVKTDSSRLKFSNKGSLSNSFINIGMLIEDIIDRRQNSYESFSTEFQRSLSREDFRQLTMALFNIPEKV